jgi:hypothetical protein
MARRYLVAEPRDKPQFMVTIDCPVSFFLRLLMILVLIADLLGDPRGVGLVADICEPQVRNNSGHFLVPKAIAACLGPEDIDYLRLKGAFSLPKPPVCDLIIRTYFHHVHPFFPIIEAKSFLDMYESAERVNLSVHLLWSMFLAASNVRTDAPSTSISRLSSCLIKLSS